MTHSWTKRTMRPGPATLLPIALTCLLLCGCAGLSRSAEPEPIFGDKALTVRVARESVVAGRSTREEIQAGLGKARVVRFESGNEVWVYRGKDAGNAPAGITELVILFGPDGVVRKSRVRLPTGA